MGSYKDNAVGILVVLFFLFVSLVVRSAYINQSLKDHTWVTAMSLIALENIQNKPIAAHWFRNIQTYDGEANKHVWWITTRIMDKNGIGYYASFPPFALIIPYVVMKLFHIPPTVFLLESINILFHSISAFFLYATIWMVIDHGSKLRKMISSAIGVAYYFLSGPNLWFFAHTYSWDILWHFFWVIELYVFITVLRTIHNKHIRWTIALLGVCNFITILTDYQGLFFAFGVCIYAMWNWKKLPIYRTLFFSIALSSALPLLVVYMQNATIAGPSAYLEYVRSKILVEYGTLGSCEHGCNVWDLLNNYFVFFSPVIILIVLLSLWCIFFYKKRPTLFFSPHERLLLGLVLLSTVLHHALLFPFVVYHKFSLLKFSIFLSYIIAILISKLPVKLSGYRRIIFFGLGVILVTSLVDSVGVYTRVYPQHAWRDTYRALGSRIHDSLDDAEVGFVIHKNVFLLPQIIYYAKRNIQSVNSPADAHNWLTAHQRARGKIYFINDDFQITQIRTIVAP